MNTAGDCSWMSATRKTKAAYGVPAWSVDCSLKVK